MLLKIQSNSRQIPSVERYTADKKYCDLLYGLLQQMSYLEENERYVNKNDINFEKIGAKLGLSRQTASIKFKSLISPLSLIEFDEKKKRYKINILENELATLVPYETLSLMNDSLSFNCISIYVYLLKRYLANKEKEYIVTNSQMKIFIGMATTTTSNDSVIANILKVLKGLNLIEIEYRQTEFNKTNLYITKVNNLVK